MGAGQPLDATRPAPHHVRTKEQGRRCTYPRVGVCRLATEGGETLQSRAAEVPLDGRRGEDDEWAVVCPQGVGRAAACDALGV